MGHSKSPVAGLSLGNVNWQGIRFWYRIDLVELFLQNSVDSIRSCRSFDERGSIEKFSWVPPNTLHTYVVVFVCIEEPHRLPNVPLADEDTGMVDALGKSQLEDLSLQPPLQEVLDFEAQDVIEFHLTLVQHTDPHQTSEQGITWTITLAHLTLTRVRTST